MKLIDILKELSELSLQKGHASNKSSSDLGIEGMIDILSVKNMKKYDYENDDKALSLVEPLINDLLAKGNVVGEEGQYKLFLVPKSGDYKFYLVNTQAETTDLVFVGQIILQKGYDGFRYNVDKAFQLKVYQVHWSNIGAEYRGKGLGKILYSMVYEYISNQGAALASDGMLYEGSSGMWRTYMPDIASYFGVIMEDVIVPITKEDVSDASLVAKSGLDTFIAMEKPPMLVRKVAHNVEGLSFAKGEYGLVRMFGSINDLLDVGKTGINKQVYFDNLIDEVSSLKELFKLLEYESVGIFSATGNITKCAIFTFEDAIAIVKQVGNKLVTVYV
jgi:GNAT superfamily N-acetyltransferase